MSKKKDTVTVMIECQEITKRMMIHDINVIAMIKCCQEIKAGQCEQKLYMQAIIKRTLRTVSTHSMVIL